MVPLETATGINGREVVVEIGTDAGTDVRLGARRGTAASVAINPGFEGEFTAGNIRKMSLNDLFLILYWSV